jgi:hypothetical protein
MKFTSNWHVTFEDQLAILFNLLIVEYSVSILGHQHDVVGDLTIAVAEAAQFQRLSHPSYRWVAPPVAKVPSTPHLKRINVLLIEESTENGRGFTLSPT